MPSSAIDISMCVGRSGTTGFMKYSNEQNGSYWQPCST